MFSSTFNKKCFFIFLTAHMGFGLFAENTNELENKQQIVASFATPPGGSSLLSAESYQELQIDKIIKKFDKTITAFGSNGFNSLQPTNDINEIIRRQTIIKNLVNDNPLYETLVSKLTALKHNENAFLGYWDKSNKIHIEAEKLYFSHFDEKTIANANPIKKKLMLKINSLNAKLNASVPALEATTLTNGLMPAARLAGQLCLNSIIGYMYEKIILPKIKKTFFSKTPETNNDSAKTPETNNDSAKTPDTNNAPEEISLKGVAHAALDFPMQLARNHSPKPYIYKNGYQEGLWTAIPRFSAGDHYIFRNHVWGLSKPVAAGLTSALILYGDFMMAYAIKNDINQLQSLLNATSNLHNDTVQVASFIRQTQDLVAFADQRGLLSPTSSTIAHTMALNNFSEKVARVLCLLKTKTFDDNTSLLYSRGRLLVAHALLKEIKDELKPLLNVIGEIDALVSIAATYKEYEPCHARFCFPTISNNDQPEITLNNFWPSLMDQEQAVLNSCHLGTQNEKNLLFSGPNGTGKSITMKAIAQCIVLFQSWGIAPAQSGHMSLFTRVETHMHPQEDLAKNMSTFVAQFSKLQDIKKSLADAKENDRFFLILDEPLNGTVESEAAKRVYDFGYDVAQMPHCCVLMATHFEKPTALESATSGVWKNVHLSLDETENSFTPTFVLTCGKQDWWFNDSIKRSRYVDCLAQTI